MPNLCTHERSIVVADFVNEGSKCPDELPIPFSNSSGERGGCSNARAFARADVIANI